MKIFIICSVRGMDEDYRQSLEEYAQLLEQEGHKVYLPHRDTDQSATGLEICTQNMTGLSEAEVVHVFYSEKSQGTHFDLGMAFALKKPLVVVGNQPYEVTSGKSFPRMIDEWQEATKTRLMTKAELVAHNAAKIRNRIQGKGE